MTRLGIAVARSALCAVVVRRTRITWHHRIELAGGESIRDGLERLLAGAPLRRAFPPHIGVTLGAGQSQLKRIEGLPAMKQAKLSSRIVRENSASFFLRTGSRIVVSDVELRTDGTSWGAAFDADVVNEVLAALRRRRIARPLIVPAAAAIATLLARGTHRVADDDVVLELTIDNGRIAAIRRVASSDSCGALTLVPAATAALEKIGVGFLSAYGAASTIASNPFVWRAERDPSRSKLLERVRVAAAGLLLAATASAALVAPGVRAQRATMHASASLSAARGAQLEAARVEGALRRVTIQLERIQQFASARGQMTLLLGAIAQSLPDSTALLTVRIDSLDGSFVALTPHASDILPQIAAVDPMILPRIVGSVTREMQGAAHVERATVRFRRRRPPTAAALSQRKETK